MKQSKLRVTLISAILSTALLSSLTQAQSSNVSVSVGPNTMNPVIVTANRAPTAASNVLADYDYIGPEEIAQAGQTSLVELLQRQRGVEISSYGTGGSIASVFLRGTSNAQSLVLIDGVRTDSGFTGGPSWQAIPLALIDHIEIIFGPQSSLYGADAIGGVVQIFTKQGEGPAKVSASTGYGTYGTTITEASIYGATEGEQKIRYSLSASQNLSMGFNTVADNNPCNPTTQSKKSIAKNCFYGALPTNRTGYGQDSITGRASQEWMQGQELGVQFLQSRLNNQYPGNAPGTYAPATMNNINDLGTYSVYSKNQVTESWKSLLQAAQSIDNGQQLTPTTNPVNNTKQNILTWQNDIAIGPDLLQILGERRSQNVFTNQVNYNTTYLPENFNQTRNTNSVAGAYQLKRGAHLANLSLRNDNITGYGSQTTGGAAYGYFFTKAFRGNINYSTGFRPPTFNDLYYPGYGNPSLQAEKSRNTEAGLHYEEATYELHLVGYTNTITNLIQYSSIGCPPGYFGCASNVANAKINGASLGASKQLDNFNVKGSFDQQNPINQNTGSVLLKRARQFGNAAVEYRAGSLTTGAGVTFSGQRYDYGNTGLGGYAIFNLYTNYDVTKDWSIFGRWNNVTNKDYQLTYGYNTPGSNIYIGARYAMK
jgi:vitamin B12 transporter